MSEDEDYSSDDTVEDEELDVDSDEEDPTCICDIQGNRVLPIQKPVKTCVAGGARFVRASSGSKICCFVQ